MTEVEVGLIGIGVQTVVFLLGGYTMLIRSDASHKQVKEQVKGIQEELKGLAKVIVELAVQNTRIDNLNERVTMQQRTVEDLRRGDGYVRREINAEYPKT